MGGSAHLNFTAGALSIAGGAAGFARAGSTASLAGGGTVGLGFLFAGYLIQTGDDLAGHVCGCAAGGTLTAAMGSRFVKTGKMMPAGAAAGVGLVALLYNMKKARDWS